MAASAPITNYNRRCVMVWAWDAKRAAPARDFASCLRQAWAAVKVDIARRAKAMVRLTKALRSGGRVALSPSLLRSPTSAHFRASRYGGARDREAGATISRLGR